MDSNRLVLYAELIEKDDLRHTPAGIPVMNFKLRHQSSQVEAGIKRQVECEVNAIALAEIAAQLEKLKVGISARFTGFISRKHRTSFQLVLHVNQVEILKE